MSAGIPCTCDNCVRERAGLPVPDSYDDLRARIAELEKEGAGFVVERAAFRTTIAHLERLGDAMAFEIEFGRGPLPSSLDRWRKARGTK